MSGLCNLFQKHGYHHDHPTEIRPQARTLPSSNAVLYASALSNEQERESCSIHYIHNTLCIYAPDKREVVSSILTRPIDVSCLIVAIYDPLWIGCRGFFYAENADCAKFVPQNFSHLALKIGAKPIIEESKRVTHFIISNYKVLRVLRLRWLCRNLVFDCTKIVPQKNFRLANGAHGRGMRS